MVQFLKHNWHWKLLSLAFAVMMAIVVDRQENLVRATVVLPVTIPDGPGQRFVEPSENFRIRAELEGPAQLIREITENDEIELVFNTDAVKPGQRTLVPVAVQVPEKYRSRVSIDWQPRMIPVRLIADTTRQLSVAVESLNRPDGWDLRKPPTAIPPRVTVSGPEAAVESVATITAPLILEESETTRALVTLQALDNKGNNITDRVRLEPAQVLVTGTQERVVLSKPVPVQPIFQVPAGMRLLGMDVTPSRVQVTGRESLLSGIYFLETDPIQIPPGQTQASQQVTLVPPREDIEVTPNQVRVTIRLQPAAAATAAAPTPPPEPRPPAPKKEE